MYKKTINVEEATFICALPRYLALDLIALIRPLNVGVLYVKCNYEWLLNALGTEPMNYESQREEPL